MTKLGKEIHREVPDATPASDVGQSAARRPPSEVTGSERLSAQVFERTRLGKSLLPPIRRATLNSVGRGRLRGLCLKQVGETHTTHKTKHIHGGATLLRRGASEASNASQRGERGRGAGAEPRLVWVAGTVVLERPSCEVQLQGVGTRAKRAFQNSHADSQTSRGLKEPRDGKPRHPEVAVGKTLTPTTQNQQPLPVAEGPLEGEQERVKEGPLTAFLSS